MPDIKINRLLVTCGVVLLTFQCLVAQQHRVEPAPLLKASISIGSDTLARQKPNIVTITLENISGRELDHEAIGSFKLLSQSEETLKRKYEVRGDSYWSPVNILDGTPLGLKIVDPEMQKKGVVVGKAPTTSLHFATNEIKTFNVDLTKMGWNDSILSGWPSGSAFEVVPAGSYSLMFEMRTRGSRIKSNEVKVTLE